MKASQLKPDKRYVFVAVNAKDGRAFWVAEVSCTKFVWTSRRNEALEISGAQIDTAKAIQHDRRKTVKWYVQGFAEVETEKG